MESLVVNYFHLLKLELDLTPIISKCVIQKWCMDSLYHACPCTAMIMAGAKESGL